jgi:hypothetical protein
MFFHLESCDLICLKRQRGKSSILYISACPLEYQNRYQKPDQKAVPKIRQHFAIINKQFNNSALVVGATVPKGKLIENF